MRVDLQHRVGDLALRAMFDVPAAGITALVGPSGAGKTTLLNCVAGLQRPNQATIEVNGAHWHDAGRFVPPHQRSVGYVFQDARLFPTMTVAENIAFGARRRGAGLDPQRRDTVLNVLGIGHLLERRPATLSGGEAQRVAIARAVLSAPEVLLFDEPLSAFDDARKREVLPFLEAVQTELALPTLYVSHNEGEVARLAQRVIALEAGCTRPAVAASVYFQTAAQQRLTLLDARISSVDPAYELATARFAGGEIRLLLSGASEGQSCRIAIDPRDVSISRQQPSETSVLNVLPARVGVIEPIPGTAQVDVRLDLEATPLLARITRKSFDTLGLSPGDQVYAQIKSAALAR